jgi:type I restriction enzyme, S subunit
VIADLKPYADYKDSGMPWLGQVPNHWETRPAFGAFVPNHDRNRGMKERTVLSLSYGRIVIKPTEKLHGLVPESFESYQIVNPGDIVLRTTDLQNDHTSLRVGIVRDRGIITSAYLALRTSAGINPEFGFQFLNVWDSSKAIYGYGSGLRQSLDFSHFKRMPVVVPPPDEQAAIVRFLVWANGRLERAIRSKRKVITLLNEQKQAIIYRAVTRGLDPSVPLKPSHNSWLGDIPKHWGRQSLWTICRVKSERNPGDLSLLSVFLDRGVIRYEEGGGQVHAPSLNLSNYQVVRPGDFVLNNQQAWRGSVGVSRHVGIISPAYIVLSLSKCLESRFANYLMRSRVMVDQFVAASKGVGDIQRQVFWPFLRYVQVPLPPVEEQRAIADKLENETAGMSQAITRLEREIVLLREYRTRLVADVVTGKLDVREAAARLPDEVPLWNVEDSADLDVGSNNADIETST